jgi:hypothetical protein
VLNGHGFLAGLAFDSENPEIAEASGQRRLGNNACSAIPGSLNFSLHGSNKYSRRGKSDLAGSARKSE